MPRLATASRCLTWCLSSHVICTCCNEWMLRPPRPLHLCCKHHFGFLFVCPSLETVKIPEQPLHHPLCSITALCHSLGRGCLLSPLKSIFWYYSLKIIGELHQDALQRSPLQCKLPNVKQIPDMLECFVLFFQFYLLYSTYQLGKNLPSQNFQFNQFSPSPIPVQHRFSDLFQPTYFTKTLT